MADRLDNTVFAAVFPGKISAILELRDRDREFDEVCEDFVALVRLAGRDTQSDPALDESLVELRREIEAALIRAAT